MEHDFPIDEDEMACVSYALYFAYLVGRLDKQSAARLRGVMMRLSRLILRLEDDRSQF